MANPNGTPRWKKGESGNPLGFSKEQYAIYRKFYKKAYAKWKQHGDKALDEMARTNPTAFCQMFMGMLPKNFNVSQEIGVEVKHTVDFEKVVLELGQIAQRLGVDMKALPHQQRVIEHSEAKKDE